MEKTELQPFTVFISKENIDKINKLAKDTNLRKGEFVEWFFKQKFDEFGNELTVKIKKALENYVRNDFGKENL